MRVNKRTIWIILFIQLLKLHVIMCYFGLAARDLILPVTLGYQVNIDDRLANNRLPSSKKLCDMLVLEKKQRRMCKRGKGIAKSLLESIRLSVFECGYQFQYERWNCSSDDQYRMNILRREFKETSFLYAISSASLVNTFARECSRGSIDRCTCDESKNLKNKEAWLWGGCGDNIKYGLKFTRKFLKYSKRRGKDIRAKVDEHNSRLGRKIVRDKVKTTCKCHGVSGSCTVQTCWRQLSPFHVIGQLLKDKYESSFKVVTYTNQATGKSHLVKRLKESQDISEESSAPKTGDMVYLEDSPNFCTASKYSPGTVGRTCQKGINCDVMCCGRGYNVKSVTVKSACQCQVHWCCYVECKQCMNEEEIYMCK
ncbi:hypothetical protein CHS0354_037501 [Potamilus streckersoni]|uniref:Protein Wnt n=1 Tax=Potamilus streckersoni TaxID=2493646 RepID=A0AAE0RPF3_9BIVA|nr:hypothetical protein CHS0354_037501 [Potamilus streckersoni]